MKRKKTGTLKVDIKVKPKKDKKLDASEGIEYMPMCPVDISKVTSSQGILSRRFHAHDLVAQHKINLHIRGYMDYYGGYAEHTRNVVYGLQDTGRYNIKVANIKTPVDVDPIVWGKNNWFINNDIDISESTYLSIAGPGWLQEKYLPEKRKTIGWTMIESMNFTKECGGWLKNADWILCPTDTDVRRAVDAGVKNHYKIHLGFNEKKYHPQVKPIGLAGLENRFVFGVLGSWNIRKGIKDIITAYCNSFTSSDKTTLLLCCKYGNRKWGEHADEKERWTIQYEFNEILRGIGKKHLPHIALIDIPVHEEVLPHIMARFDCLLGFSSGESTWLPGLQAMGMKIPVIQLENKCCGYMEYLNDDNSYLCKDVKYEECSEEFWKLTSEYYEGQTFGYGNPFELQRVIKDAYFDIYNDKYKNKVEKAYADSKLWTWDSTINQLDYFLQKIC